MASQQRIGMHLDVGGPRGDEAFVRLQTALDEAAVTPPDESGFFEVRLAAESFDAAVHRVFDGVALAGVDDEIRFVEHPQVPGHWRTRPRWARDERADDGLKMTPEDGQAQGGAPGPDAMRPGRREAAWRGR